MSFQRIWDEHCPRVWDSCDGLDGVKWVIRDLRPEEDEEAINFLLEHFVPDETFCCVTGIANEPVSVELVKVCWRQYVSQRMSLACYEEKDDTIKLVALLVCVVRCQGHKPEFMTGANARTKTIKALTLLGNKVDLFEILDVDMYLRAVCLAVHRDYREHDLGLGYLQLGLHHHINGFVGEFTSSIAQTVAKNVGYITVASITFKELAEAGIDYPNDETKSVHLMAKKIVQDNDK